MITTVIVTLDGRILIRQGREVVEIVSPAETGEMITGMVQALAMQVAIMGLDAQRGRNADFERETP